MAEWLNENSILATIKGLILATDLLQIPLYSPRYQNQAELLANLTGIQLRSNTSDLIDRVNNWWQDIMIEFSVDMPPLPTSHEELCQILATRWLADNWQGIMPIWDLLTFLKLKNLLSELENREARVIKLRIGLVGEEKKTLKQVGAKLLLTEERIRQIEAKALRKLRWRLQKQKLTIIYQPIGNALERELAKRQNEKDQAEVIKTTLVFKPSQFNALFGSIDRLELSVRSANCLYNTDIKLVGELVQMTEAQLLSSKILGRKSLKEIKEVLAEMELSLGIYLDEETKELLKKQRKNLQ